MIIKLQADQVGIFWESIKYSMIQANKIPKELEQDFGNKMLEKALTGLIQCWMVYKEGDSGKEVVALLTTRIIDNTDHGFKVLLLSTLSSFRLLTEELVSDAYNALEAYALANECSMLMAETSIDRVKDMAIKNGFEPVFTTLRRYIGR